MRSSPLIGGKVSPTSGLLHSAPCARSQAVGDDRDASRLSYLSVAVPVMARAMRRADCRDLGRFKALVEA